MYITISKLYFEEVVEMNLDVQKDLRERSIHIAENLKNCRKLEKSQVKNLVGDMVNFLNEIKFIEILQKFDENISCQAMF